MIINRFEKLIFVYMESDNPIVKLITCDSVCLAYSSIGYNFMHNHLHLKHFSDHDLHISSMIRYYRHVYGTNSPFELDIICMSS